MQVNATFWCRWNAMHLLRDSVVSDRLGYVFVPIGKAANTVVKRILWDFESAAGFPRATPDGYFDVQNPYWRLTRSGESPWALYQPREIQRFVDDAHRHFLFTVVRNPLVRLLSAYLDRFGRGRPPRLRGGPRAGEINTLQLPRLPRDFAEFVAMVCEQDDAEANAHWVGQVHAIGYDFLSYDFIGNFERFDDSLRIIATQIGANIPDPPDQAPHKTSAQQRIAAYYTHDLVRRVVARFERDFACFGYSDTLMDLDRHRPDAHARSGRHAELTPPLARITQAALRDAPATQLHNLIAAARSTAAAEGKELILARDLVTSDGSPGDVGEQTRAPNAGEGGPSR